MKKNGKESRPYRILHCIDNLGRGGAESQMVQTLLHIDKRRFENYVCFLHLPNDLEKEIIDAGLPITNLNINSPRNFFQAIRGLRQSVRKYKIDLIHASTYYSNLYAPIVGAIEHIPVVFTLNTTYDVRDYNSADPSFMCKWRIKRFYQLRAFILKVTKASIIAVSNSTKKSAIEHLKIPAEKIQVVYRGLIPENYKPEFFSTERIQSTKHELGITNAFPILVNVGRLWSEKGQKDLIQAMPHILKSYPQAQLLIAGIGPLAKKLESLRDEHGLKENVRFLGLYHDIPLLLAISDIFVAASYLEGCPNAIAESMAAGKPIVAYSIPVCHEIMEEKSGILVDTRDPIHLAKAVLKLTDDPKIARDMGNWGMNIVSRNFDIRINTKELENIYEKILNRTKD